MKSLTFDLCLKLSWVSQHFTSKDLTLYKEPASEYRTLHILSPTPRASLLAQMVKKLPVVRETQVRPWGQEDPTGEGNGYPLYYSGLEDSMDRGAWWAAVHEVTKSQT